MELLLETKVSGCLEFESGGDVRPAHKVTIGFEQPIPLVATFTIDGEIYIWWRGNRSYTDHECIVYTSRPRQYIPDPAGMFNIFVLILTTVFGSIFLIQCH